MAETNQSKSQEAIIPLNNGGKTGKDGKGKFIEGNTFGEGRPLGRKNFGTIFDEAIKRIVEEKKINISDPEIEMVTKAIVEALKGNYAYYRDTMDRKYGRPSQPIELGGELPFKIIIEKDGGTNKEGQTLPEAI